MDRLFRLCALVLVAVAAPSAAFAQGTPPAWTLKVKLGSPIFITMLNGDRIEGTAGQITTDGLVVATPTGIHTAPFASIRKVDKRDSIWSGVGYGAAIGVGIGVLGALTEDCHPLDDACRDVRKTLPLGVGFWGAMVGWWIDASVKGRSPLFDPEGPAQFSLKLGPRAVGARLAVSW